MVQLVPWGWHILSVITIILYGGFYVTYADEISSPGAPDPYEYGDLSEDEASFIQQAWDTISFGAFNDQVDAPELLSVTLFLACGVWWVLIFASLALTILEIVIPG